jgi:predicted esterase
MIRNSLAVTFVALASTNRTWNEYKVAGMDVLSVTEDHDIENYDKIVVMLHGGYQYGEMWREKINQGWFGEDISGFKYVFPTSTLPGKQGPVWYGNITDDPSCACDLCDDCYYEEDTITDSAQAVKELIEHEISLKNLELKDVFLGGFSQGA